MKSKKIMLLMLMLSCGSVFAQKDYTPMSKEIVENSGVQAGEVVVVSWWATLHSTNGSNCNREQSERCFYNGFFKYRQHNAWPC